MRRLTFLPFSPFPANVPEKRILGKCYASITWHFSCRVSAAFLSHLLFVLRWLRQMVSGEGKGMSGTRRRNYHHVATYDGIKMDGRIATPCVGTSIQYTTCLQALQGQREGPLVSKRFRHHCWTYSRKTVLQTQKQFFKMFPKCPSSLPIILRFAFRQIRQSPSGQSWSSLETN